MPFDTVLIANRGEIAVRVMRTLRRMGIRAAAVYSDADAESRHVHEADVAVHIGPAPAARSYLNVDAIMQAASCAGADAVHPGYGFLSENEALVGACESAGLVFIGPPAAAMRVMGDKIKARQAVAARGVPVVPGIDDPSLSDAELAAALIEFGFPALIKPSAGGGGKGMRVVEHESTVESDIAAARRQAVRAFGDDALLVERYLRRPRHIEIQVMADCLGNVVHLGERECSLQRRHQKIVEEAPSPIVSPELRHAMGEQAVQVTRSCRYVNAGTVEFIVDAKEPEDFYFLEMNTRLQVEHPVTELVYGVDLVEAQVRVAAGQELPWRQEQLEARGHAIEARVYAEDPSAGFLPTGGKVLALCEPQLPGVRVDSGIRVGASVTPDYDPMLAKVIAHGSDRTSALHKLDQALATTAVLGVTTNLEFLRALLTEPLVVAGDLDTRLVDRLIATWTPEVVPRAVAVAAAVLDLDEPASAGPWDTLRGWRLGPTPAWTTRIFTVAGRGDFAVGIRPDGERWAVTVDGGEPIVASLDEVAGRLQLVVGDEVVPLFVHRSHRTLWIATGGSTYRIDRAAPRSAGLSTSGRSLGPVTSPMPGTVVNVLVAIGDTVGAGQAVAIVEAMKMEHTLVAPADGIVQAVHASPGQQVTLEEPIVTIAPPEHDEQETS